MDRQDLRTRITSRKAKLVEISGKTVSPENKIAAIKECLQSLEHWVALGSKTVRVSLKGASTRFDEKLSTLGERAGTENEIEGWDREIGQLEDDLRAYLSELHQSL